MKLLRGKPLVTALALWLLAITIMPVSAQNQITVYATAQRFEKGLMIWRSDNAFIWVLGNNGQVLNFPARSYSNLPDNPIFGNPPSRLRPIFGFGKVWGNNEGVRNLIGWPTLGELGFNMPIRTSPTALYLTQLDNTIIQINNNGTWQYANTPPVSPVIDFFTANPITVTPSGSVTLNWQARGVELVLIETYDSTGAIHNVLQDLPIYGNTTITIPSSWSSARCVIYGANRYRGYSPVPMYARLVSSELTVTVQADSGTTTTTQAAFQVYQKGYMVWEAATGGVMVFYGNNGGIMAGYPQSTYETLLDNPISDVPAGCIRSINGFGRVWGNYADVRNGLGCALTPEQNYTMTITSFNSRPSIYYSFPDGRTAKTTRGGFWNF